MLQKIKSPWYKYLILIIIGIILMVINVGVKGDWQYIGFYIDGAFIAGTVLILLGGLSFVNYEGTFDIFSYLGTKRTKNGQKITYREYSEVVKEEKIKKGYVFIPYIIVGIIYILIGIILLCLKTI